MTNIEIIENRIQFGADERKIALGKKLAQRTIEQLEQESNNATLEIITNSIKKWSEEIEKGI